MNSFIFTISFEKEKQFNGFINSLSETQGGFVGEGSRLKFADEPYEETYKVLSINRAENSVRIAAVGSEKPNLGMVGELAKSFRPVNVSYTHKLNEKGDVIYTDSPLKAGSFYVSTEKGEFIPPALSIFNDKDIDRTSLKKVLKTLFSREEPLSRLIKRAEEKYAVRFCEYKFARGIN